MSKEKDNTEKYISIKEDSKGNLVFDSNKFTYFEIVGILTHFRDSIEIDSIQEARKK